MKIRIMTTTLACIFLAIATYGQDSTYQNIKEPEFPFEPMVVNADLSTTPLPKENGDILSFSSAAGFRSEFLMNNPHSTFDVKGNSIKIIVKHEPIYGTNTNPRDTYKLYKVEVNEKKKKRTCIFYETKRNFWGKTTKTNSSFDLPLSFVKIKENVYLVSLENLKSGEYLWLSGSNYFTFRVE